MHSPGDGRGDGEGEREVGREVGRDGRREAGRGEGSGQAWRDHPSLTMTSPLPSPSKGLSLCDVTALEGTADAAPNLTEPAPNLMSTSTSIWLYSIL